MSKKTLHKALKKLSSVGCVDYNNPEQYIISHDFAEMIWMRLFELGLEREASMLSTKMISQGCEGINIENAELILNFWKDHLEELDIFSIKITKELH